MGKGGRFKKRGPRDDRDSKAPYIAWEYKENESFNTYYRAQKIVPEEEFATFVSKLIEPLPTTFRVNQMLPTAASAAQKLQSLAPFVLEDGTVIEPPRRLPWYPGGTAWHVSSPKSEFRKHAAFKAFHQWLVSETEAGCLSR